LIEFAAAKSKPPSESRRLAHKERLSFCSSIKFDRLQRVDQNIRCLTILDKNGISAYLPKKAKMLP
jgi:hypothetical protein